MARDDAFRDGAVDGGTDDYDPDQPIAERRAIQRGMRSLIDRTTENQDDFLEARPKLYNEILSESQSLLRQAKQTSEAAIDSRLVLQVSELAYKRSLRWTSGSLSHGIDVDEFVSKCVTYMRHGHGFGDDNAAGLSGTQRQRRAAAAGGGRSRGGGGEDGDDDIGDEGDMLDWAHLGRFACVPHSSRPALPGFLLGPLAVEKKQRRIVGRTARLKINSLREVRPEVLRAEDLAKSESSDLTSIVGRILNQLVCVQAAAQARVTEENDDLDEEEEFGPKFKQLLYKHGLRSDGGVDLLRFVVNPHSFGQTVENMFYVSFLIRDGKVGICYDDNGLPSLYPVEEGERSTDTGDPRHGAMKHQAIMSMDMATWRDVIEAFDIREPMIPHRREEGVEGGPGSRGWYS